MADDFYALILGIVMLCAGVLIGLLEAIRLVYPSAWDPGDVLSDVFDREIAILVKLFFGWRRAVVGLTLMVYTPTLGQFFEKWNNSATVIGTNANEPTADADTGPIPIAEAPFTLPVLPGSVPPSYPATTPLVPGSGTSVASNSVPLSSSPSDLLDTEHELLLGHLVRPPKTYSPDPDH